MYGGLTGLSKAAVRSAYGERRFRAWRRGYRTRPPAVDSFSRHYPGNDATYRQHARDVRFSARESLVRSLAAGRPQLHRKLPKTESLHDCMQRTVPYWNDVIAPRSVARGRSVLISSSENAIRGLLMHLLHIPESEISSIEIPTGLPLVFDMRHRCLRLLEGDFTDYNFGAGGDLLFTPCEITDDDFAEISLQRTQVIKGGSSSSVSSGSALADEAAAAAARMVTPARMVDE